MGEFVEHDGCSTEHRSCIMSYVGVFFQYSFFLGQTICVEKRIAYDNCVVTIVFATCQGVGANRLPINFV